MLYFIGTLVYIFSLIIVLLEVSTMKKVEDTLGTKNKYAEIILGLFLSLLPIINTVVLLVMVIFEYSEVKILKNKKIANMMYRCKDCGMHQRRYQQTNFRYQTTFSFSEFEDNIKKSECSHCGGTKMLREKDLDNKEIVLAKKIGLLKAYWVLKKEVEKVKKEKKEEILKQGMHTLYINDVQIENYQKIQEKKMNEYHKKAEEIKKELNKFEVEV